MASELPAERRRRILGWLKEHEVVSIDFLVEQLGVSVMTVHRDLDRLAADGLVEKVHGGVALNLVTEAPTAPSAAPTCAMCHKPVATHMAFIVHPADQAPITACCPHCGLMLLRHQPEGSSALATDFIHGHRVNARQALYLVEPEVHLCCVPTVLAFASEEEARRFQKGFNGHLLDFNAALSHLMGLHHS